MIRLAAALVVIVGFTIGFEVAGGALPTASITASDSWVSAGEQVTFTAVYPAEARKKVGQRQPFNPIVAVGCANPVTNLIADEHSLGGGWWEGVTLPITLVTPGTCSISLGYFAKTDSNGCCVWHRLAGTTVEVL
jgi:hypothetical protein